VIKFIYFLLLHLYFKLQLTKKKITKQKQKFETLIIHCRSIIIICLVSIFCYLCRSISYSFCLFGLSCVPLRSWSQGLLSRLSDLLLCRWSCRSCWQWCWECSCCQSTDEEVEILGPFPAQTPSWLWVHTRTQNK